MERVFPIFALRELGIFKQIATNDTKPTNRVAAIAFSGAVGGGLYGVCAVRVVRGKNYTASNMVTVG